MKNFKKIAILLALVLVTVFTMTACVNVAGKYKLDSVSISSDGITIEFNSESEEWNDMFGDFYIELKSDKTFVWNVGDLLGGIIEVPSIEEVSGKYTVSGKTLTFLDNDGKDPNDFSAYTNLTFEEFLERLDEFDMDYFDPEDPDDLEILQEYFDNIISMLKSLKVEFKISGGVITWSVSATVEEMSLTVTMKFKK